MRTFKDGKLKPDCFSESRLLAFPPACGVMLIMLNRYACFIFGFPKGLTQCSFHNYVVEQLATINERGRFTRPSANLPTERAEAAWKKYDNDLFQTGRLYDRSQCDPANL
jgi:linoleate 10R-lipoxygenase